MAADAVELELGLGGQRAVSTGEDAVALEEAGDEDEQLLARERLADAGALADVEGREVFEVRELELAALVDAREVGVRVEVVRVRPDVRLVVRGPEVREHQRVLRDVEAANGAVAHRAPRHRERAVGAVAVHLVDDRLEVLHREAVRVTGLPVGAEMREHVGARLLLHVLVVREQQHRPAHHRRRRVHPYETSTSSALCTSTVEFTRLSFSCIVLIQTEYGLCLWYSSQRKYTRWNTVYL